MPLLRLVAEGVGPFERLRTSICPTAREIRT